MIPNAANPATPNMAMFLTTVAADLSLGDVAKWR